MRVYVARTAAIVLILIICVMAGLRSAAQFPEDEHILSVTKVLVPSPGVSPDNPDNQVKGRLDQIVGRPMLGATVTARGWAVDESTPRPVDRIEIVIDGLEMIPATTGDQRPDVADAFNRPEFANAGWSAQIPLDGILPGEHKVDAIAYTPSGHRTILDGTKYIEVISVR